MLDEIRDTGYAGTELGDWGFMPTDPARLQTELGARRLDLVGAFVPVPLADRGRPRGRRRHRRPDRAAAARRRRPDAVIVLVGRQRQRARARAARRAHHAGRRAERARNGTSFAAGADRSPAPCGTKPDYAPCFIRTAAGMSKRPPRSTA